MHLDVVPGDLDAAKVQACQLGEDGAGDVDVAGGAAVALVDDLGHDSLAAV